MSRFCAIPTSVVSLRHISVAVTPLGRCLYLSPSYYSTRWATWKGARAAGGCATAHQLRRVWVVHGRLAPLVSVDDGLRVRCRIGNPGV